ncbi:Arginyl-tRNA--protein transferase 1 [Friedmanniomyces endolithicus]|uniref:Arginyl-tRNA--protein transferase 1 n=1 Tax=Friedmanniomyces endolithicus TaxID=329885 RepID=A0AAN6F998_9PEZI|nr:Arginyl-tRNA--protein transferase 1 [Friedmanniomyces endolithicus]KAK0296195.1 Arginyl-tRNA--protein transferase 1 [Friedmanniomyces endolithicus]KAK0305465.1 Arginyl-tRNA--protein transferase 1 [Friedmanniomyces endolithicus]KAK1001441.1 Arginyl-tRNA--protein transferase 1 [Friedmanniomyces endolithicus]
MDRGWRRSGTLFYLPDASRSCCPHYTIRLPVVDFRANRDQRQSLHRWNRYVLGEKYIDEVKRRHPKSKAEKKHENNSFDLITSIHESESRILDSDVEPEHVFEVTLEPDSYTNDKFALFSNYQRHVHHESDSDITREGFKRFLCGSPLHRHADAADGKPLGSYHQCYRLDGRLIAMSVLDLLPHAVSGVYFLYHSDFEKWSFGKLSALRETALALEQGYEYYYMGYYIHCCKKMRYKGDYKPQYVLDYYSWEWDVLDDEMRVLMDRRKYASMSVERKRKAKAIDERPAVEFSGSTNGTPHDAKDTSAEPDHHPLQEEDDSEEDSTRYPTPVAASRSKLSLLDLGMPGVLTLAQLRATMDLDNMRLRLSGRAGSNVHEMREIVSWDDGSEMEPGSIKGQVAEFAAAVGAEVAGSVVMDFSRG